MAILGLQEINIGLPNESTGSDSLYTAFTKTKDNFANLFANASPLPVAGNGIAISNVANSVIVSANLVAGNNIILSNVSGAVRIDAISGGGGGSLTGVIAGTGLSGGGFFGNVTINLGNSGVNAASYTNPTITVDATGRIISASNNVVSGTVTSVGLAPGSGISISGGPITSNGNITVVNTGVTRLSAGTGISLSSSNGNVTISTTPPAAVTSVGISSTQLVVTGSPVTSSGTISVNLPSNVTFTGNVAAGNVFANSGTISASLLTVSGNISGGNISTVGNISVTGRINYDITYGCFHKIANVVVAAANTIYNFDWYANTTPHVGNQGVTVTSGNPTRINIDKSGSYVVLVEMQAKNTDNAERDAWVWLSKNGTNLAESTIKVVLLRQVQQVITKQWLIENIADNDYIEVKFAVNNTSGISLEYVAAQTTPFIMPAQPSATITIAPVGA